MYEYKAIVVKIVDGDTIDVSIDLGFKVWLNNQRVRLKNIDTPECRTRDLEEKKYGLLAKSFVENIIPPGTSVIIKTDISQKEKFGRILGEIFLAETYGLAFPGTRNTSSINQQLIDNHLAVYYHGQSKKDIEEQHIENRSLVTYGKNNY